MKSKQENPLINQDRRLVDLFLGPVRKCTEYKPAFGQSNSHGLTIIDFQALYGQDPFYAWIGLDDPILYAAHRTAGGLTSVYRQVGVGSERLLRAIIMDSLDLTSDQIGWRYNYSKANNKEGVHILDAKITFADLSPESKRRFDEWLKKALRQVAPNTIQGREPTGAAFEIRQGYKSADSKRQNADLRFGIRAYQAGLLPVFTILSRQVSESVIRRYRSDGMLVLTGAPKGDSTTSTFAFFKDVVDYDLAAFFARNSETLKHEVKSIIRGLLTPE